MGWQVVMSLFKPVVLLDVMQVISSKDHGSGHLVGKNDTLEDSSSDGDIGGEWALVVNVSSFNCGSWGLESETDFLVESWSVDLLLGEDFL